jgi:DNA helicase-2/ATP-dependent DNA helicase PcrA
MKTAQLDSAIEILKPNQREAVDHIYGPVMVIAGPGTGKTQILSTRIGNILLKTDTDPRTVLCLTYTEAASTEMRDRLSKYIGAIAHNVNIHTFHGFCSRLISEYPEYFGDHLDLKPLDDIERLELFMNMIDAFNTDHELKRKKGKIYFEKDRMNNLFSLMKKENWDFKYINHQIDQYITELPTREGFYYKRPNKKRGIVVGDPKQVDIKKETEKMEKLRAAAREFDNYNQLLLSNNRFDYQDMILWVINAFKKYPDFLQITQERFQFILVDEYQDTSGAQNELLFLLCGIAENQPNVFVVGDEDQSIFKFQGANVTNILDFHSKFSKGIKLVLLKDNFRSSADILSASRVLIENNTERIPLDAMTSSKILVPAGKNVDYVGGVKIAGLSTPHVEMAAVYKHIRHLMKEGARTEEIAVLFRKHKDAEPLIKLMRSDKIAYQWKKHVNVLEEPIVKKIINILSYISAELKEPFSGEPFLFNLLHYDLFDMEPLDLARMAIGIRKKKGFWRELMIDPVFLDEVKVANADRFIGIKTILDEWLHCASSETIQVLFEKIIYSGPVFNYIQNSNETFQLLSSINTIFEFIKTRTDKDSNVGLSEFLELIQEMKTYDVSLSELKLDHKENGVQFITAHSSKGHQFDHVIIIGCNKNKWEASRSGNYSYKLPATITDSGEERNIEEDRRLFYVAMTRARRSILMTYSQSDIKGDDLDKSRFLLEVESADVHENLEIDVSREELQHFMLSQFAEPPSRSESMIPVEVDEVLKGMKLNISAVNKYLQCPLTFYYENILRAPMARNAAAGFGNAVHFSLDQFFKQDNHSKLSGERAERELLRLFDMGMEKYASHFTKQEYENYTAHSRDILPIFYKHHAEKWKSLKQTRTEYKISTAAVDGIAVSGIFDRVDISEGRIHVTDYKTGNPIRGISKLRAPLQDVGDMDSLIHIDDPEQREKERLKIQGQDYWRQMVFYRMIAEADPWNTHAFGAAYLSFVEPNDRKQILTRSLAIEPKDMEIVKNQLRYVHDNVQAKKFSSGCNLPYCKWCMLINDNE